MIHKLDVLFHYFIIDNEATWLRWKTKGALNGRPLSLFTSWETHPLDKAKSFHFLIVRSQIVLHGEGILTLSECLITNLNLMNEMK